MQHKPRTGNSDDLTRKEAADLLEVDTDTINSWLNWLTLFHEQGVLISENNAITLDGLAILKEFRGNEERYFANHCLVVTAMSRAELGRHLGMSGRDVSGILGNIEQIHSLEGFTTTKNRLTQLAIARILEYRILGLNGYALKHSCQAA